MRHATPEALVRLAPLLAALRTFEALNERNPGTFYRGSRAFLHFHEHGSDIYADVRGATDWDRYRVTTATEQKRLLATVRRAAQR